MTTLHIIVNTFNLILQTLIILYVVSGLSDKSISLPYKLGIIAIGASVRMILFVFVQNPLANTAFGLAFNFVIACMYKIKCWKRFAVSVSLNIVAVLAEMFVSFISAKILGVTPEQTISNPYFYVFGSLASIVLQAIIAVIIRSLLTKQAACLPISLNIVIVIMLVASCTLIFTLTKLMYYNADTTLSAITAAAVAGIMLADIMLIYVVDRYIRTVTLQSKNKYLEQQNKYYTAIIEKYKINNKQMHDINKRFCVIERMIEDDRDSSAHSELQTVKGILDDAKSMRYTGITAIDAILSNYIDRAKRGNTIVDTCIKLDDILGIDEMDISILLGNLLENAVEECERLEQCGRSTALYIEMVRNNADILICTENSASAEVEAETAKKDIYHHGYGKAIIRAILEKYHGDIVVNIEEGKYIVKVLINSAL